MPRTHSATGRACWALALAVVVAAPARGAQLVALDMKATGGVPQGTADALTPILVTELGRRPGISVVSQADVKALLEHSADRQLMECSDESCLAAIAGSLGAELLLTSTISRVGRKWVVTLSLLEVAKAKVFRRATGETLGSDEAAVEAVVGAVHNLFRDSLPDDMKGPASMSRLGFKAALAGFTQAIRDPKQDGKAGRRRLILDLVNTELDYDAAPKIDMLDTAIRRQVYTLDNEMLDARDEPDFRRLLHARQSWLAVRQDLERVKEIRQRARERGVVPSAQPLRFEEPDPPDWPDAKLVAAYKRDVEPARRVVAQALKSYRGRDQKGFVAWWSKEHVSSAERAFVDGHDSDERYGYSYQVVALHAIPPWLLERAIESQQKGEMLVYLLRFKKGEPDDDRYVYLVREQGKWRIRSW
ncbi:MAG: hypothetical protein JXR83_09335 [Deltaproteobacteria bacterium]|nr:hypothetical protein [Deltaproteobacteria bacterium]